MTFVTAPLAQWDPTYLRLATAVHVPSAAMIDTEIAGDANLKMLGPYGVGDAGVESVRCRKTVYIHAPYVGLLLSSDLTPVDDGSTGVLRRGVNDCSPQALPCFDWGQITTQQ